MSLAQCRKAVAAALTAGAGVLTTAAADGAVTLPEWGLVAVTVLAAGGSTWAVRNKAAVERALRGYDARPRP